MKCVTLVEQGEGTPYVHRETDAYAAALVARGTHKYAPKWAWKAQRDVETVIGDRKR